MLHLGTANAGHVPGKAEIVLRVDFHGDLQLRSFDSRILSEILKPEITFPEESRSVAIAGEMFEG